MRLRHDRLSTVAGLRFGGEAKVDLGKTERVGVNSVSKWVGTASWERLPEIDLTMLLTAFLEVRRRVRMLAEGGGWGG